MSQRSRSPFMSHRNRFGGADHAVESVAMDVRPMLFPSLVRVEAGEEAVATLTVSER